MLDALVSMLLIYLGVGSLLWALVWHPKEAELLEALFANSPLIATLDVAEAIVCWPVRLPFIRSFLEGLGEH